jgi:glutathione S-transferase
MMKLFTADLSAYSARVRMQIYAKGITDIVFEQPGEHWGMPNFRERFPIGRVPVLDVDGDTIPESEVIAEYLEEIYPEPSLLGRTPRENAHIRMLARFGDVYIMNAMFLLASQTGHQGRKTPATTRNDPFSVQLVNEFVRNLKALDRLIGRNGFACLGRIRWRIARLRRDSSGSRRSCRRVVSTRRFQPMRKSPPIGRQSKRTNMRQGCCPSFATASKSAAK